MIFSKRFSLYKIILAVYVLVLALAFFSIPMSEETTRTNKELWDLVHIVAFAILTILVFKSTYWISTKEIFIQLTVVVLVSFLLGALVEILQVNFGRTASWHDVNLDVLGAVLGWILISSKYTNLRGLYRVILIVIFTVCFVFLNLQSMKIIADDIIARQQVPVLSDFSTPFEITRWSGNAVQHNIVSFSHGKGKVLRARFLPTATYSSLHFKGFFNDWTGYEFLEFDIYSDENYEYEMVLRIHDYLHNLHDAAYSDRFNKTLNIKPGENQFRINLNIVRNSPAGREMHLDHIKELVFFISGPSVRSKQVYFRRISLM